jgi:xylulokinase
MIMPYIGSTAFSCERNWRWKAALDLHRQDWDESLLKLGTSSRDWLGKVLWPSEVVGEVTREAARHTGLAEGTPVVAGSADHIAGLSAGVKSGDLLVKLEGPGTSSMIWTGWSWIPASSWTTT